MKWPRSKPASLLDIHATVAFSISKSLDRGDQFSICVSSHQVGVNDGRVKNAMFVDCSVCSSRA